jgi:hypothetical protein
MTPPLNAVLLGDTEVSALYVGDEPVWAELPAANGVLWSATHDASQSGGPSSSGGTTSLPEWYAPSNGATDSYGGGEYNSGGGTSAASSTQARSGSWSAKLIADTTAGSSGARLFRWAELRAERRVICESYFFFPVDFTLTANPATGHYLDLFQFKARRDSGVVDPFWLLTPEDAPGGGHRFRLDWSAFSGLEGPHVGEHGFRVYRPATDIMLPVGQWFGLRGYIKQSKDFDGAIKIWYLPPGGGAPQVIVDETNVRTGHPNTVLGMPWQCANEWSVNNYSDGLSPTPYSLYVDDARISSVTDIIRVPDQITAATAYARDQAARIVIAAAPNDRGAAIDTYRVTSHATGQSPVVVTSASRTIDVPGLTNGVSYTFDVEAHNSAGYGAILTTNAVAPAEYSIIKTGSSTANTPTSGTTNVTTHAVSRPTTASDGDVAEVAIVIGTGSGGSAVNTTISATPTGWTLVSGPVASGGAGELRLYRYRRKLDGTADDTFTATTGLACRSCRAMCSYRGVDPTTPSAATPTTAAQNSGANLSVPAITTAFAPAWAILAVAALTGSQTVTAAGMTSDATIAATGTFRLAMFEQGPITPSGSFGPKVATFSGSPVSAGILDALRPEHL